MINQLRLEWSDKSPWLGANATNGETLQAFVRHNFMSYAIYQFKLILLVIILIENEYGTNYFIFFSHISMMLPQMAKQKNYNVKDTMKP